MALGMFQFAMRPGRRNLLSPLTVFITLLTSCPLNASADCETNWNDVYNKQAEIDLSTFRRRAIEVLDDPTCSPEQRRRISRDAVRAHIVEASRLRLNQRQPLYERATRFGRPWELLEAMGTLLQTKRDGEEQDFSSASRLFQEALFDIQKEHELSLASKVDLLRIQRLAEQSRFLSPVYVRGTYFGAATRGIAVQSTALPIQFLRDSDTMTELGVKYAEELAKYLQARHLPKLVIIGHTDHDGSNNYNLSLSRRRADAVRSFLLTRGYAADSLKTVGRGYHEPIKLENPENFDSEQVKQLLRRVEVQIVP